MTEKTKKEIPRWEKRVIVFQAVYSNLLTKNSYPTNSWNIKDYESWTEFEMSIYDNYIKNKKTYLLKIKDLLKDTWSIERIHACLLALVLESISEYHVIGTEKGVLIRQAQITAKIYCEDEAIKLINGILHNYFKNVKN